MTKTEFIRKLAEKRKSTLVEAEKELDAFLMFLQKDLEKMEQ